MQEAGGPAADWKEAANYAPLLQAERSVFAWEWLRRRPDYRDAARRCLSAGPEPPVSATLHLDPAKWGLHRFEPPELQAPAARPVWRAEVHPYVLRARTGRCGAAGDCFDLASLRHFTTIVPGDAAEHLLFSDGIRTVRLDILEGPIREGAVELHYCITGFKRAERSLATLRRLLALCQRRSLSGPLYPPAPRPNRLVLLLRAHDALAAGATQRQMAEVLLSGRAAGERWRVNAPSLRSQVQRLSRSARLMASGGFWQLLK